VEHTVPQAEAEGGAREGRRVAIVDNLNGLFFNSPSSSGCHFWVYEFQDFDVTRRFLNLTSAELVSPQAVNEDTSMDLLTQC
jgi:hypothetical protein